ncbi:nucleoporin NUP188-like protein [Brachionus plicatilis]|uniref:Nucleoporin NUP188-like protein n=1 Tax=Brachionus plicatilis TaxID=10195 RepID=A0A3M7SRJ1_BRAPC|nr:nucleoporin NUP188-like protein [Brachionus plicatilis]
MEQNESLLKKMVHSCCRIFSKTINNLEDSSYPKLTRDTNLTFVVNNNLLKFIVNNFSENYWQNELAESCFMQCLYVVLEKCVYDHKNYDVVYSIFDLFFTFSDKQAESLAKSDFNTRTCLLTSKIFEYSSLISHDESNKYSSNWKSILKLYISIQTVLLKKLKYKYLKDSILFFGSYFETIGEIISKLDHSLDTDLLDIIRAFSRYFSQISFYSKELILNIQNSTNCLQRMFTSIVQLCIMKLSHVRIVSMKHMHHHSTVGWHQNSLTKLNSDDLVNIQNMLFTIISLNLDGLFNFSPNFADQNYSLKLDEYKILLTSQISPPSAFDAHTPLSFGSILWLVDYLLKLLHKHDILSNTSVLNTTNLKNTSILSSNLTPNKRLQDLINSGTPSVNTSPKKSISIFGEEASIETKLPNKSLIVCVLEKSLNFLLSQIYLCERQGTILPRDRKMLKRELNSEIVSYFIFLNF